MGKKNKGKDGGKKGKKGKGKKEPKARVSAVPKEPEGPPPPPPVPPCNKNIQPLDPCESPVEGVCKEQPLCRPNHYPGLLRCPQTLAVAGTETGTYDSICKLLRAGFLYADRVLAMTPWGNYVVFKAHDGDLKIFFVFAGCSCNINRFRYMDINCGTAGFLYFDKMHDILTYIIRSREERDFFKKIGTMKIEDVCKKSWKY